MAVLVSCKSVLTLLAFRALLNSPLEDLQTLNANIAKASIRMDMNGEFNGAIRCTSTDLNSVGCPTVHPLTRQWQGGNGLGGNAIIGETSWLYNDFPNRWKSAGGDFQTDPIGQLSPPSNFTRWTSWEFPLDIDYTQQIVDKNIPYFGFILKDDSNIGSVGYVSRDWNSVNAPNLLPPQLVVEFSLPTPAPVPRVTPTPTISPVSPAPAPDREINILVVIVGAVVGIVLVHAIWMYIHRAKSVPLDEETVEGDDSSSKSLSSLQVSTVPSAEDTILKEDNDILHSPTQV